MHPLPPPPDTETMKNWAIFLTGIAWVVYQTWQSKTAVKTATAAKTKADTTELRVNGHSESISDLKTNQIPPTVVPMVLAAAAAVNAAPASAVAPSAPQSASDAGSASSAAVMDPNATRVLSTGDLPTVAVNAEDGTEGD